MDRKWYARRRQTGKITRAPARTTRGSDLSWPCIAVRGISVTRYASAAAVQIVICSQSELNQLGNALCEPRYGDPGDAIRVSVAPEVACGPTVNLSSRALDEPAPKGVARETCADRGLRSLFANASRLPPRFFR
jgi:hypothetical protein